MERGERNRRSPSLYELGKAGLTETALQANQTCVKGLESGKLTFTDNTLSERVMNLGAPIECRFGQNLDNLLTNVQVLSRFCPIFVQVLSMSNNCQNNLNFTKFCLIFVNILSNIFVNCPRFV